MTTELSQLAERGKLAFAAKKYDQAADLFAQAITGYEDVEDAVNAAEMKNNLSVALLQAGKAQAAYESVAGTHEVFAQAGDVKRQAMAFGNEASALEKLKKLDEALAAYERSAELFAEAGEGDMRSMVLQSAAAIKLKRGKMVDSALSMIGSIESTEKPNLWQRFLKFIIRLRP